MGIRLDQMLLEIEDRLKKDYDGAMWSGRLRMFFSIIGKTFESDRIVHSHFAMKLMDLQYLKEVGKNNKELLKYCEGTGDEIHAQTIGWLVSPYMNNWFTGYKSI